VTRLPGEGVYGGGGVEAGLRSLKVDFISDRATGPDRVTRLPVEGTGGGGGVEDGLRFLKVDLIDSNFDPDRGLTVTRLPVERGGIAEDGLRSLKVDFIDSKFNPGRPDCPNVIRVPAKEGGSGAGAEVGLRSLVCARKVDLIGSSFDRGRAAGDPTMTRVPVEGVGGRGVSEGGWRSLDSALKVELVDSPGRATGPDCGSAVIPVDGAGEGGVAEDGFRSLV
jgi:hypothetical protein